MHNLTSTPTHLARLQNTQKRASYLTNYTKDLSPNSKHTVLLYILGRSNSTLSTAIYSTKMKVKLLPALQDNYMFMIICEQSREAAIIDPVEPEKCLTAIKEENVKLTHILTTHHHW